MRWSTKAGVDILGELFYKPGDILSVTGAVLSGFVTSRTKVMFFSLPVGKSLANITTISGTTLKGSIRVAGGGYLNSENAAAYDWLNALEWEFIKADDHTVRLKATSSSAYTNVSNNAMVVLYTNPLELEFN